MHSQSVFRLRSGYIRKPNCRNEPTKVFLLTRSSSEILPLRLRQRGSAISTAANWICNYVSGFGVCSLARLIFIKIIVQITPPAISNIGWRTYIIFAILNATWVPIIYLFFPETKGLELEDVDHLFSGEVARTQLIEKPGDEERFENITKF